VANAGVPLTTELPSPLTKLRLGVDRVQCVLDIGSRHAGIDDLDVRTEVVRLSEYESRGCKESRSAEAEQGKPEARLEYSGNQFGDMACHLALSSGLHKVFTFGD
jgi:hypothetical protein